MELKYRPLHIIVLVIGLSLFLAACGDVAPSDLPAEPGETAVSPTITSASPPTDTAVPTPTSTPLPSPTAIPSPTPLPPDLGITTGDVYLYPVPAIYAGEQVTIQVAPTVPERLGAPESVVVRVLVDGLRVAEDTLNGRNLAGQAIGLFEWVWNTEGQEGKHQVEIILDPDDSLQTGDEDPSNNQILLPVNVQPSTALDDAEANATWVKAESDCCFIHAVSGTAAYRDLPQLVGQVETAVQQANDRLQEPPEQKLNVYFIERVIGQGGYAGSEMVVSYPGRRYAGGELHQILVHEATHVLDRQFAPHRISFLAEGVAVWTSGGHYKPEDVTARTAALLRIGRYVPLTGLINNFYPVQHEIGYLQAAGFVDYLVSLKGWSRFRDFYSDVTADDAPTPAEAVDTNLQTHYNATLVDLESEWQSYLRDIPLAEATITDLQTSLRFYETMRNYQRYYDPTAHFLTAWLPYPHEVREQGNTADFNRHPEEETHVALEVMFQAADTALRAGQYNRATVILDSIDRVIVRNGAFVDPLALNYLNVVRTTTSLGYEPQHVLVNGNQATVLATPANRSDLVELNLRLRGREWVLSS